MPENRHSSFLRESIFEIEGLHCASCIQKIEACLQKLLGVVEVNVSLVFRHAKVTYDPLKLSEKKISQAIKSCGYQAKRIDKNDLASLNHFESESQGLKWRTILSIILTLPVFLSSMFPLKELGGFELSYQVQFVLASLVFWGVGFSIHQATWRAFLAKSVDMNTLITLGTAASYFYSMLVTFFPDEFFVEKMEPFVYFDATCVILTIVLVGRFLEVRAKGHASRAIQKLFDLRPTLALLCEGKTERKIPLDAVKVGDILRVKPGESVPVDGTVIDGSSEIDESMLTGESHPKRKKVEDWVYAGTMNQTGSFRMEAREVGEKTTLAKIVDLVKHAQSSKAPIQNLVDRVTQYFIPVILCLALSTFMFWSIFKGAYMSPKAILASLSVLVIACPCALGIATPIAAIVAMGTGAKLGVLFRNGSAIQKAASIDTIMFDKTGTVTVGRPVIAKSASFGAMNENQVFQMARALEAQSEHPIAQAFLELPRGSAEMLVEDFKAHVGEGVSGKIDGKEVLLGNLSWVRLQGVACPDQALMTDFNVFLAVEKEVLAGFAIQDALRAESKEVLIDLKTRGYETWLVSGDQVGVTDWIAKQLGIEQSIAEATPDQKLKLLRELQNATKKVAMIGDGINDAPALAASDLGVAMASGTDIAIESADITLLQPNLKLILRTFDLSKKTMKIIKQNLFLAFGYNIFAVPLAMSGMLNPMVASMAMMLSGLSVICNALRLKNTNLRNF